MLRKVEDSSTVLATCNLQRNIFVALQVGKMGVTLEFFLAAGNATFAALQVARNIASCNMAFNRRVCDGL